MLPVPEQAGRALEPEPPLSGVPAMVGYGLDPFRRDRELQELSAIGRGPFALDDVLLRQPLGWGTIANMLSIGVWVDWLKPFVPAAPLAWWIRVPYLLLAVLVMGFATAVYVGVNAGAGPRDSLMLAVSRLGKVSVRVARTSIEIGVVLVGWLLGGPVGVGTLLFALSIGPAVQLAFRLLRVRPLQPVEAAPLLPIADEP